MYLDRKTTEKYPIMFQFNAFILLTFSLQRTTVTIKHSLFARTCFGVTSQEHGDAKIKSSPIISNERIKEQDMINRENKIS